MCTSPYTRGDQECVYEAMRRNKKKWEKINCTNTNNFILEWNTYGGNKIRITRVRGDGK